MTKSTMVHSESAAPSKDLTRPEGMAREAMNVVRPQRRKKSTTATTSALAISMSTKGSLLGATLLTLR